ncbi:MAG: PD40 domain-containing protein [Candidatus Sabulitectum sp.]|nr:PD40 domain-containing protein [Candidatus Sabulitectum sp.]
MDKLAECRAAAERTIQCGKLYATRSGDSLYFADNENGYGQNDIWLTVKNGTGWSSPANLEPPVNTIGDEGQPFISADGNELWKLLFPMVAG